jgi:chromosomal replication initiation ATPase DnaA
MNDLELIHALQRVVAEEAGLKRGVRELLAHDHEQRKAKFRDSAIYLARIKTDVKLEEIGKMFGARHHTTILGAIRREKHRLLRKPPRRDGRTWVEWHEYLYNKATAIEPSVKGPDNA